MAMHVARALRFRLEPTDKQGVARYTANGSLQDLQGTIGRIVFRRDGTALELPEFRDPKTPLQMASRGRVRLASEAWATLSPEEYRGWSAYAALVEAEGARSPTGRVLRPYDLFCGLGCKSLQIHGGTEFPKAAPERPFLGDALSVQVRGVANAVRFEANGPNGPLALTELLWQRLRHAGITPQPDRYRTQAFVAYAPGNLTVEIDANPARTPARRATSSPPPPRLRASCRWA